MSVLDSIRLMLLIGPAVPLPAPPMLIETLESVEITQGDDGPGGLQMSFALSRGGLLDVLDYTMLLGPLLKPFSRVIVGVTLNGIPTLLFDGVITHRQHAPDTEPGDALVTITCEDVSVMMDLQENRTVHPCLPDMAIAAKLILSYPQYGLIPDLRPPLLSDIPLIIQRVPTQQGTDLDMLRTLARRNGFVFYVDPGPAPMVNTAYWGPPKRLDLSQRALATGLGWDTNVTRLEFAYDALAGTVVSDTAQDSLTGMRFPVETFASTRVPPLALDPGISPLQTNRSSLFDGSSGLDAVQIYARAMARTDLSSDAIVTAKGELDALRYGGALHARGIVGVRGAGFTHDGMYYVKQVTHKISKEQYTQSFTLTREGEAALLPVVVP
jgi:hypothetical protein